MDVISVRSSRSRTRGSGDGSVIKPVTGTGGTADGVSNWMIDGIQDDSRIETLIPYRSATFAPQKRLGKLNLAGSPWAISAKLGRFLLSGAADDDAMRGVAKEAASYVMGTDASNLVEFVPPEDDDLFRDMREMLALNPGSVVFYDTNSEQDLKRQVWGVGYDGTKRTAFDHYHGGQYVLMYPGTKWNDIRSYHAVGREDSDRRYSLQRYDLPTTLGTMELLGDGDTVMRTGINDNLSIDAIRKENPNDTRVLAHDILCHRGDGITKESRRRFDDAAISRWDGESIREANRRYASQHSASVFEDKRQNDERHTEAASHGFIAREFKHVEIDDDVDIDAYDGLQREFQRRWDGGELPQIDTHRYSLRFRKTGRHHTEGVYCNALDAIAVDPRAPYALLHEFANAYDYAHGQLSCSEGFRPILREFSDRLDTTGMTGTETRNAKVPTEVFARSWEVYAAKHGTGGSFVRTVDEMRDMPSYEPLLGMDKVDDYFDRLTKGGKAR